MLFDTHGRPLPRFYDLTVERRAQAIAMERAEHFARRVRMGKADFFIEACRLADLDDSVAALDLVPPKDQPRVYQRILMGAY